MVLYISDIVQHFRNTDCHKFSTLRYGSYINFLCPTRIRIVINKMDMAYVCDIKTARLSGAIDVFSKLNDNNENEKKIIL